MDEPLYKDRDWLYQKIVVKKLKDKDVAKMFGVTRKSISYWRKKFNIEYPLEKHEDKKWMYKKLITERLSIKEMANQAQVTEQTIRNRADKFELDYREKKKSLIETHPELSLEWYAEKNDRLGLFMDEVTFGSDKVAWWQCQKNERHVWDTGIGNRARMGSGCPYCNGKRVLPEESLQALRPDIAEQWNFEKNDGKPSEFTLGSAKEMWWKCRCGYGWNSAISTRTRSDNNKCPSCEGVVATEWNCLATLRPDIASEWHPTKNGKLTAKNVTVSSGRDVWWKCNVCDFPWKCVIAKRTDRGDGCINCSGAIVNDSNRLSTIRPDLALQWDSSKNVERPDEIHVNSNKKHWWKCDVKECGYEWDTTPSHRNRNEYNMCPECNGRTLSDKNRLSVVNPELAKQWDYKKNYPITPHDVSFGQHFMAWWICDSGHSFDSMVHSRNQGKGCRECNYGNRTSYPEQAIYYYIKKVFPESTNGENIGDSALESDILIPSIGLVIEYDGYYFHQDRERDIRKNELILENNLRIARVRERGLPYIGGDVIEVNGNRSDLNEGIERLLRHIKENHEESLSKKEISTINSIDVNHKRDSGEIQEQYKKKRLDSSIAIKHPHLLNEWHERNAVSPYNIYHTTREVFWWKCSRGHVWKDSARNRSSGNACSQCHLLENNLGRKYPEIFKEWHPTKNGDVTPFDLYPNSKKKIWVFIQDNRENTKRLREVYVTPHSRTKAYDYRRSVEGKNKNEMEND